ncbi:MULTISPECIES: hypothetical protein [unclassified Agromyces]|uniref:hypothetical protein n=1 Tax=unclassified Agromyces TaxID=2639701 RepID=UPI003014D3EA
MPVAHSSAPRSVERPPSRRRSLLAVAVAAAFALAGPATAVPAAAAETGHEPAATRTDGTAGVLAGGVLLLIAGGVAVVVRRAGGPHAD